MKKFIGKVCIFGVYALIITVLVPVLIDPYNVFHKDKIRDNGIEPNKNYIKMSYVLDNPDKFDSFLFGSSRVGAIHTDKIEGENCYNMTYSVGLPAEHLANLKTMISNGIIPEKVYMGVDSISYTVDYESHYADKLKSPYEYSQTNPIDFFLLYLNPMDAVTSLSETLSNEKEEDYVSNFYEYGWWCGYDLTKQFDWTNVQISTGTGYYMDETLQQIQEMADLCQNNGIEFIVFTNPVYELIYEESLKQDYLVFLERLADITPYYNFSGINDITTNTDNYIDSSHYNAYIGDMILECICNGKQYDGLYEDGFGMYVTGENVDELLEILN